MCNTIRTNSFTMTARRTKTRASSRRALVTGASAGIGQAFAEQLARDGWDLCIVARRRQRLEQLARRLRKQYGIGVAVVEADLTDSDALRHVEARIKRDRRLELLINNAATAYFGPFIDCDRGVEEKQIQLDVLAVVHLTHAALPGMLHRRRGAIINVSSVAALTPGPHYAVYAAGKSFVNTFTEALHFELSGSGVRFQALCPGLTRTDIFERAGADTSSLPEFLWMTPDDVVAASLADLECGTLICVPGIGYQALVSLGSVIPQEASGRIANFLNQRAVTPIPGNKTPKRKKRTAKD